MKDAKEALYCIGQMADKCLTSLGAIQKDYKEFVSLVKRMREAQKDKAWFESEMDRKYRGNDWLMREGEQIKELELYNKVFDLESEVDKYLMKIND